MRYALDAHPTMELISHKPYIGGAGLAGPCESAGFKDSAGATPREGAAAAAATADKAAAKAAEPVAGNAPDTDAVAPAAAAAAVEELKLAGRLMGRGLLEAEAALVQRFDPAGLRDTPGFFIAKFRKRQT